MPKRTGIGFRLNQAATTHLIGCATQHQSLGSGYALINNKQWMTIATNIAGTAANWSGGAVGSGSLNRGNSDGGSALAASSNDNQASWNINRRTHTLSNGSVIWDLAGNVLEWVDFYNRDDKASPANGGYGEISDVSASSSMAITEVRPTSTSHAFWLDSWNSSQGIGMYYHSINGSGGAMSRGGVWYDHSIAGVFAAGLGEPPSNMTNVVGFRCAFSNAP